MVASRIIFDGGSTDWTITKLFEKIKSQIPKKFHEVFLRKLTKENEDLLLTKATIRKIETIFEYINFNNIQCIFVSEKSFYNQICLAKRMKDLNKKSISVSLSNSRQDDVSDYCEKMYQLNLLEFVYLISKTSITLFSQGWLFRSHQVLFIEFLKKNNRHFVDFMDLNSFLFPTVDKKIGFLLKEVWGGDAIENNNMQKWCEKKLLSSAERCFFAGSIEHVTALKLNQKKIQKSYFVNISINSDMFVEPIKSVPINKKKFAYAGGFLPIEKRRVPEFFSDAQLVSTIEPLLKRNPDLSIDVYNNPLLIEKKKYPQIYRHQFCLSKKYKGYNFKYGSDGKKIRKKLSKYYFGLLLYNIDPILFGVEHHKNIIPTTFYLYLEAGIPMIVSSEFTHLSKIATKNEIGITCKWHPNIDLNDLTSKVDLSEMRRNIIEYRNKLKALALKGLD